MVKYYFVGTLLPVLSLDLPPELSFGELDLLLRDNLSDKDYDKTLAIRLFFDILNLRSLWKGEELDSRGYLSESALEEALVIGVGFPSYVYDFIDKYPKIEDRIHHFPFLLANFFQNNQHLKDPFLINYFNFERELRLITTAFRAKKLNRELSLELQYENPEEEFIAQMLKYQDSKDFELPERYQRVKEIFQRLAHQPLELQKALDQYRLDEIDHLIDLSDLFSIERILAYITQLIIVEKWSKVDKAKGIQIVDSIVKEHRYHETTG